MMRQTSSVSQSTLSRMALNIWANGKDRIDTDMVSRSGLMAPNTKVIGVSIKRTARVLSGMYMATNM